MSTSGRRTKYFDSIADFGSSSDFQECSKQQQSFKVAKDEVPSQREQNDSNSKYQSKLKIKPSAAPVSDQSRNHTDGKLVLPKSSNKLHGQSDKGKGKKDGELIKYMSNLPGYLKRVDGEETSNDSAFNVGVLDWARLEQWKNNKNFSDTKGSNVAGSSSSLKATKKLSFSSAAKAYGHQTEKHPFRCQGDQPSVKKAVHFKDVESSSKDNLGQRKTMWNYKNFNSSDADDVSITEKLISDKENSLTYLKSYGIEQHPEEQLPDWNDVEEPQQSDKSRRASYQKTFSEAKTYKSVRTYGASNNSKEKIDHNKVEVKERREKSQDSNINLGHQNPGKLEKVVLLLPRQFSNRRSKEEPKVQSNVFSRESEQSGISGSLPQEKISFADFLSDNSCLCSLPSKVKARDEPYMVASSANNCSKLEFTSNATDSVPCSNEPSNMISERTKQKTTKHTNSISIDNAEFDQDMGETVAMKSRSSSPNRRFSFSLGKMGRSLSLREGSNVPQLSSTYVPVKSDPLQPKVPCADNSNKEKAKGQTKSRSSSPFKRILEPLFRSKGSSKSVQEPESSQPTKESSTSYINPSRPIKFNEPHPKRRPETSRTQALLQLSIKNGIPLFKFVVDNNSSVLAATMKNLTSPGKDDLGENYTFYAVNEIKKKNSGWRNQGSKVKSESFVYNVVGQMKVSALQYPESDFKIQNIIKESVLYGVEVRPTDRGSPKLMTNKELAAIVVKLPSESSSNSQAEKAQNRDKNKFEKGFTELLQECGSTSVILPGGIHGLPSKGGPTPLIQRWKTGGLCDCGGWDVGCKLRILANHEPTDQMSSTSNPFADAAPFELFAEVHFLMLTKLNLALCSSSLLSQLTYLVQFMS